MMVVNKTDKLQIKTLSGVKECEIVRITKNCVDVREARFAGQPAAVTGFQTYSIRHFFNQIKSGVIAVTK